MYYKPLKVKLEPDDQRLWNQAQVKLFVEELLKSVGGAWAWMTPRMRKALVAEEALAIVRLNHRGDARTGEIRVTSIDALYKDMIAMSPIYLPGDE